MATILDTMPPLPSRSPRIIGNDRTAEAGSHCTPFNTPHLSVLPQSQSIPQEPPNPIVQLGIQAEERKKRKCRIPAASLPGIPDFEPFNVPFPPHKAQVSPKTRIFQSPKLGSPIVNLRYRPVTLRLDSLDRNFCLSSKAIFWSC